MAPTKPTDKRRYVPHVFDMGSLLAALKSSDFDERQGEAKGKVKSQDAKTSKMSGRKSRKLLEPFGLPSDSNPHPVAATRQLESFLKKQKGGPWQKTAGKCKVAKKSEGKKRRERERKQRRKAERAAKSASA